MLRLSARRLVRFSVVSWVQERRLLGYLAKHRRSFLLGFACVVVTNVLTLAGPWLLKYAIDDLRSSLTLDKVRGYAVALLLLAVVGGFFQIGRASCREGGWLVVGGVARE